MSKVHQINSDFWHDKWIMTLTPNQKLFYNYLITGPDANLAGIYQLSLPHAALDTGIPQCELIVMLTETFKEKVLWGDGWVYVINRLKHNRQDNPNIQKGVQEIISHAPVFIRDFLIIQFKNSKGFKPFANPDINIDIDSTGSRSLDLDHLIEIYKLINPPFCRSVGSLGRARDEFEQWLIRGVDFRETQQAIRKAAPGSKPWEILPKGGKFDKQRGNGIVHKKSPGNYIGRDGNWDIPDEIRIGGTKGAKE